MAAMLSRRMVVGAGVASPVVAWANGRPWYDALRPNACPDPLVEDLLRFAERLTGWRRKRPVTVTTLSDAADLRGVCSGLFDLLYADRDVAAEEGLLQVFRIHYLHQVDLRRELIHSRVNWLRAVYDPTARTVWVLDHKPGWSELARLDILRELVTALQIDRLGRQHYDPFALRGTDQDISRRICWGSQAQAVQLAYMSQSGSQFAQHANDQLEASQWRAASVEDHKTFARDRMTMPLTNDLADYVKGATEQNGWAKLSRLCAEPPRSTLEQMTNASRPMDVPEIPDVSYLFPGWTLAIEDRSWGQWQTSMMCAEAIMEQGSTEPMSAVILGDRLRLYMRGEEQVLVWSVRPKQSESMLTLIAPWWQTVELPITYTGRTAVSSADWETLVADMGPTIWTIGATPKAELTYQLVDAARR